MKNIVALTTLCIVSTIGANGNAADIDFNRDVRPILSDKCYFCHGPDENTQEAGLRLDSREEAADVIESGELMDRITSDDPDVLMPPPDSKIALTDQERQTVQAWIDQGAVYKRHWAFERLPYVIALPEVDNPDWCNQPLDRFVLQKMNEAGLSPAKEAAPHRWLRRVMLDLTGLPPTPDQIELFESRLADATDSSAQKALYEATVDEILDSETFGEHMAVAWLDAARYADSYGYQSDKLNTQWPYRDWVVKAFNDNLSYDQFLTWQLAGDLLPNPTREQRLATAFNRIHRLNNEGGAVFEEWRIENVADRVHTFGTAVLGLTLECCRCHDHKYDPIPMRDYYSLSAFFNSIDESGVYDRTQKVPCPSILLPTEEQESELAAAQGKVREAEEAYRLERVAAKQRWQAWRESKHDSLEIPDLRLGLSFDRGFDNSVKEIYHPSQSDRSWTSMVDLVDVVDSPLARMTHEEAADLEEAAPSRRALKLDGERGVTTKGIEPFDRWSPFSVVVSLRETFRSSLRSLIAHHTRGTDCGYNGWDLTIVDGHLESRMYRVWPGNAIGVRTNDPIPQDQWHQVTASYDGSSQASGLKIFLNGKPLATEILRDELKKSANVKVDHGGEFVVGQRFRARGFDGGLIDDVRVYERALTESELEYLASGKVGEVTLGYFVSAIDEPSRELMSALTEARQEYVMVEESMNEVPIMLEMQEPRVAHVLARGQYDAPTNEQTKVTRRTLSELPLAFPEGAPLDRLGLAQWVTDPQHPLTARVAVNRFWGNFFAEPLVRTPENFGSQGELPTHPELLDWLARDFVDHDWDVKRFCKQVVLSSVYRQDSAVSPELAEKDPTNRLLARGSAYRMAAEQIRDVALSAAGLLNPQRGGPPVSPYQPGGDLWKESNGMSPPYEQSVGQALYRRSLYSVWKRTAPLPNMLAFDSTTREVCTVKRFRTNTPLQALVLLNDVQFVEAARALAQQVMSGNAEDHDQVHAAFLRLTGRRPDKQEQAILLSLLKEEREYYASHEEEASKLIALGESEASGSVVDLAALTTVCQTILNLDATIWKR